MLLILLLLLLSKLFLISLHTVETKGILHVFFTASDDNNDKSEGDVRRGIGGGFWRIEDEPDIDLSITFLGLDKASFKEFEIEFFKELTVFVELFAISSILSEDNKLLNNGIRAELELDKFEFKFLLFDITLDADEDDGDNCCRVSAIPSAVVDSEETGESILKDWIILLASERELA